MNQTPQLPSQEVSLLTGKIITFALIAGATLFLGVIAIITFSQGSVSPEKTKEGLPLFLGLSLGLCVLTSLLTKPLIGLVKKNYPSPLTLQQYISVHIVRMALAEGPALFGLVGLIIFAPKLPLGDTPELALFLIPYANLLFTGLHYLPSEEGLKEFIAEGVY